MSAEQHDEAFRFELLLSAEELDGLREQFKDQKPDSVGNRLIATIDQRDRALADQVRKRAVLEAVIDKLKPGI